MRKVRTRVWSTLIAVAMLLTLLPTMALAADLPAAENDSITLTDGVYELSGDTQLSVPIQVTGNVTLDLAGHTLSPASEYSASYLIKVSEGGNLTLTDSGATGKITTNDNDGIRGISNNGTFTMASGAIEVYSYAVENVVTQRSYGNNQPVICNITGGELTASYAWTVLFMGAGMAGQSSEGKSSIHTGEKGSVRNDLIRVNISGDAKITGDQALTTNASNGIYAGFTLNISENAEISGGSNTDNCAIYLPAVGETTISGGTISGDQGIRIAAGELNITGGTIEGTKISNEEDLIAGGSGGTMGAIVVGKAGGGYIGDVLVNVEEKATVKNVATEDGDKAAIVVSDKFMGDASKGYDALSITVNVKGATVEGNVVKVSNVNPGTTADGGSTTLALNGATVTGSVINQTKDGDLDITGGTVTGSVTNDSAGSVTVSGSSVAGNVENKSAGEVVIQENATVTGSVTNTGDGTNKGAVAILNSTVGSADMSDGSKITIVNSYIGESGTPTTNTGDNEARIGATSYATLADAITHVQAGETITLLKNITVQRGTAGASAGVYQLPAGVTLDGNGHSINYTGPAVTTNPSVFVLVNSGADNVTIKNVTLNATSGLKHGVQFYCNDGGTLDNVVINGGGWTALQVNGATNVTVKDTTLSPLDASPEDTNPYANIEYCMGSGVTDIPSLTVDNVTFNANYPQIWADNATLESVKTELGSDTSDEDAIEKINDSVNNRNSGSITVVIGTNPENTETSSSTIPGTSQGSSSGVTRYNITIEDMENGDVTSSHSRASRGTTVTLTINPDDGYELDEIIVTDANGDEVDLTRKSSTKYTFEMPRSRVTVEATFVEEEVVSTLPFDDVDVDDWFYDAVEYAYENDLMNGVSSDEFDPNGTLTRGMMVTVLYRLEGEPESRADLPFEDVEAGAWYTEAVRWAVDEGIVLGTSDTTYEPDAMITREQLATMLYRYAEYKDYDTTQGGMAIREFEDYEEISDWALEGLDWAVNAELVNGVGNNTIAPLSSATRAETATLLMRFIEAFEA